ncbi:glutathione S-transferase family protein [Nocardia brevicatena]|uniref:glutathione S-transferase family protein n=1 Tax=Nocardia brevicatena TaxID=37327 RepID=UPI0002EDC06E|nr:glutathione S-transferase family protein [Nocardia brevicatena]
MLILYVGDLHFSGWSMRGRIAVAEKDLPVTERIVELDWPTSESLDGVLYAGDGIDEREASIGCACDAADLAEADVEDILENSAMVLLPRVPILTDTETGSVAGDVVSIAEYLDEIAPESDVLLMGATPSQRALVRSVCAWASHDLPYLREGASYARSLRADPGTPGPGAFEQARWVCDIAAGLLHRSGGPFLVGDFGLADVMVSTYFQQMRGWNIGIEDPAVADYARRLLERPSIATHIDEARVIYRAIDEAPTGSPQWILRHYRYHPGKRLLHDWQRDRCERLVNATAVEAVRLAYQGLDLEQITHTLAHTYRVPPARVADDVAGLFARLSPA